MQYYVMNLAFSDKQSQPFIYRVATNVSSRIVQTDDYIFLNFKKQCYDEQSRKMFNFFYPSRHVFALCEKRLNFVENTSLWYQPGCYSLPFRKYICYSSSELVFSIILLNWVKRDQFGGYYFPNP